MADGAVIEVTDAEDRTEPVDQTVEFFPGGVPQNPQFILSKQPGNQITTFDKVLVGRDRCLIRQIQPIDLRQMRADQREAEA